MSQKKFDPAKPHKHLCPICYKQVYCAAPNCDIAELAECHECRNGITVRQIEGHIGYYKDQPRRFEGDTGGQS